MSGESIFERITGADPGEIQEQLDLLILQRREITAKIDLLNSLLRLQTGDFEDPDAARPKPSVHRASESLAELPHGTALKDLLLHVFEQEPPGTPWRAGHVIAAVKGSDIGRAATQGAILAALSRLVEEGTLTRPRKGTYVAPPDTSPSG